MRFVGEEEVHSAVENEEVNGEQDEKKYGPTLAPRGSIPAHFSHQQEALDLAPASGEAEEQ